MPATLAEITKEDPRKYFIGESYQRKLYPKKSIGGALINENQYSPVAPSGPRPAFQIEGFANGGSGFPVSTPGPGKLAAMYYPEPEAAPDPSNGQFYHPINLTETNAGGLSAQMAKQLEEETESMLCVEAMAHYRRCKSCRKKMILELQHLEATGESLVLGGEKALRAGEYAREKNELSELLTLAGVGIFTIFLVDAFSKFGARIRS